MTRAAIIDLDGTLCVIEHRLHHVTNGAKDWKAFFNEIEHDTIAAPIRDVLVSMHRDGTAILLCSGRPEKCREVTVAWLTRHDVPYTALYMRPDDDTRPDHVVKRQILQGIREDGYEPFLVIDDRQSVVEMWREEGILCLQCAPSDVVVPKTAALTLMVGPTGAGKSTWLRSHDARELGIDESHIISSDQIRADLCGDFRDQSRNAQVFAAAHAVAKTRLLHGLPTVIDATHLRRKDRMAAAQLVNGTYPVRYIVINRPMHDKLQDAGWRAEVKGLIERHEQVFKSQLKDILAGDGLASVTVHDLRDGSPLRALQDSIKLLADRDGLSAQDDENVAPQAAPLAGDRGLDRALRKFKRLGDQDRL